MRYHLTTVRMTTIKKTSTGEDVEKREPSCTADGNGKLVQPLWKTLWRFLKTLTIEKTRKESDIFSHHGTNEALPVCVRGER